LKFNLYEAVRSSIRREASIFDENLIFDLGGEVHDLLSLVMCVYKIELDYDAYYVEEFDYDPAGNIKTKENGWGVFITRMLSVLFGL